MSHTDDVKYPSQPTYTATVANEETLLTKKDTTNCGAKCFMSVVSVVFVLLGLAMSGLAVYTLIVLSFGGVNVLSGYSMATVYTLLIVGLVLLALSISVWVSSCKPNNCCSKFILTLFAIVMVVVFLVQVALIVLGCLWLFQVQVAGIDADTIFNDTIDELYDVCCQQIDTTGEKICSKILGDDNVTDCASTDNLYTAVVAFITPLLQWVFAFLGVVAFLNIVSFACSCCLICAKSRSRAIYKPATTYANGV